MSGFGDVCLDCQRSSNFKNNLMFPKKKKKVAANVEPIKSRALRFIYL